MNKYHVEYTDTFSGEANYSWVKRATVSAPELIHYRDPVKLGIHDALVKQRRVIMRKAKAAVGLTGVRGVTSDFGDMIEFRPYRSCTVMFVTIGE